MKNIYSLNQAIVLCFALIGLVAVTQSCTDSNHTHSATDITTGVLSNARLSMGDGGGIDADMVDGNHAAAFALTAHVHDGADVTTGKVDNARLNMGSGNGLDADTVDGQEATAFAAASHAHDGADVTTGTIDNARLNMGTGNGLDADTVDGQEASDFAPASHTHTSADLTNGPGLNFEQSTTATNIAISSSGTSWDNLESVSVAAPSAGYILVTGRMWSWCNVPASTYYNCFVGIGSDSTSIVTESLQVSQWRNSNTASLVFCSPFSVTYVFSVTGAGTYTYYLNAQKQNATQPNVTAKQVGMQALFFPTKY